MPYIELSTEFPGILSLFQYKQVTEVPLRLLAETLLRGPSPISSGERELIATFISRWNDCSFCYLSHGHTAAALLEKPFHEIRALTYDTNNNPNKIGRLLDIAGHVLMKKKEVENKIAAAKAKGATDEEIHDTVLIASAFCMFNRYVDGLGTTYPTDITVFQKMGQHLAKNGYLVGQPETSNL